MTCSGRKVWNFSKRKRGFRDNISAGYTTFSRWIICPTSNYKSNASLTRNIGWKFKPKSKKNIFFAVVVVKVIAVEKNLAVERIIVE